MYSLKKVNQSLFVWPTVLNFIKAVMCLCLFLGDKDMKLAYAPFSFAEAGPSIPILARIVWRPQLRCI